MNVMIHQQAEREAQRVQANREELVERIGRAIHEDGTVQPLQGLHLSRRSSPLARVHSVVEPSVAVIAQGSKEVLLGESRYQYDPSRYLLATVELPRVSQVLEASKERPYLSLRLELAPTLVSSVMVETGHASPRDHTEVRAIDVSPVNGNLLDAFVRLVRLLHFPIEQLARELDMSASGLHHHFKAVTAMSPLQFQKRQVPPIAWGTRTPPTSIESTKASSAFPPCATCNGCGKLPWKALADEKGETQTP